MAELREEAAHALSQARRLQPSLSIEWVEKYHQIVNAHDGVAWESLQDCTLSGRWRGHRERANARGHVFEGACRASLA